MMNMKKVKFIAQYIPHDVLLQILHKLPVKSLAKFSCVCKLWFNLFTNDQGFKKSHFLESQKNPILMLAFQDSKQCDKNGMYYMDKVHGNSIDKLLQLREITPLKKRNKFMEGYCNGLVCSWNEIVHHTHRHWFFFSLEICNPSRFEKLIIQSRFRLLQGRGAPIIWGFRLGYDCLRNQYKVLCVFYFLFKKGYKYFIYTLGSTKPAWREIEHRWADQLPGNFCKWSYSDCDPPRFCDGSTVFGKIIRKEKDESEEEEEEEEEEQEEANDEEAEEQEEVNDDEEEEDFEYGDLISFDFHDEEFQVIKRPDDDDIFNDYNKDNFNQLEYKGCFCVASLKKFDSGNGIVELHILKDRIKKVWIKEAISFDIPTEDCDPGPPCSSISRARIICCSDQIFLYWRRDSCIIQLYNVHTKELKEVKHPTPSEGDVNCFDYYISSHVENFTSLKSLATAKGSFGEACFKNSIPSYIDAVAFSFHKIL